MATYPRPLGPHDTLIRPLDPDSCLSDRSISTSRAADVASADTHASSLPHSRFQDTKTSSSRNYEWNSNSEYAYSRPDTTHRNPGHYPAPRGGKCSRLDGQKNLRMELHQSTCLNLSAAGTTADSGLWILPDFDEWEIGSEDAGQLSVARDGSDWAPLVQRAVNSNRERLRRRLEGDGWDFVCGKYGDSRAENGDLESADGSASEESSVDEEFDVVVLEVGEVLS